MICEHRQKFSKVLTFIEGGYNEMTKNSFENKALSNLAETCNAENGTYRGGDSAVGIWRDSLRGIRCKNANSDERNEES